MATKKKPTKKRTSKLLPGTTVSVPVVEQRDNIVIPASIGDISACCDKHSSRYALEGFRLQVNDDGSYEVAATDSACLAVLKGKRVEVPFGSKTTTHRSGINTSQSFDAIVHPKDWKTAVAASSDKQKMIGVAQQGSTITLVCDDKRSMQTRGLEGRFPSYDAIIPSTPPAISVPVHCKLLAKLAACAAKFTEDITIEFREGHQALVFRGSNHITDQEFIGLMMPVAEKS